MVEEIPIDELPRLVDNLVKLVEKSMHKARAKLRGKVSRIDKDKQFEGIIIGIDTAFPHKPLEYTSFTLTAVTLGSIVVEDGLMKRRDVSTHVLVEVFSEIDHDQVVSYARLIEREKALHELASGMPSIIMIDGELLPLKALRSINNKNWLKVHEKTLELIETSRKRDVNLIGVVKRSYSKDLASLIGVRVNDRVLASMLLNRGEYISLVHPFLEEYGCKLVFYKPLRGPDQALKLEVCGEVGDIVSILAKEAGSTGFPWIIDIVDSLVKQEVSRMLKYIESYVSSRIARLTIPHVGLPANLQEKRHERKMIGGN